ncbi:uncharacterized protein LOC111691384 [Anoplophora glabripennis]|uniref:uncharacterized protein LOC111691384 n=1 Tax=Anoplophora glabripennis TaxID=217634 RepID=UPI000C78C16D|nr:uncharacterized protein LOC111691384 [Anoplophora glabripennis]
MIRKLSDNEKLNPTVVIELESRLLRQETLLDEFNECQAAIETVDDSEENRNEGNNQPILQKTSLGWVISGTVMSKNNLNIPNSTFCNLSTNVDVQQQLQKFWEIEDSSFSSPNLSAEEKRCEDIFCETVTRNEEGRFIVTIPLKEPISRLGESKQLALNRFESLEIKFRKNPKFYEMYSKFMAEYENLGHMTRVVESSVNNPVSYFLPHHGVLNENSATTKLRVVFDGSAPSKSGWSFNDLQLVGPTIQNDLLAILLRFRKHKIVICADVEKMYRQVLVKPEQRNLQQILWRSNTSENIHSYTLNTVTYGTSSAPYLAIRCLIQLANDHQNSHPEVSEVIKTDFYVDDLISGADTPREAIELGSEISHILGKGCFKLHKWISNDESVLNVFQGSSPVSNVMQLGAKEQTKTLGLYWVFKSDVLKYNIRSVSESKILTKRKILSDISRIFDPLGLLSPCVITAKILLQLLWTYKLSWDDELPSEFHTKWIRFRNQLSVLNRLEIPRHVVCTSPINIQLHGFADAAQNAYGACLYVRSIDSNGVVYTSLLCSKSKVAPVKLVTIPRLELCAALVLSQLVNKVKSSMNMNFDKIVLWSDSTITLHWIKMIPNLLQTFVANRVTQIQNLTKSCIWRHVRSGDNPADLLSRGIDPNQLCDSNIWWQGPNWLCENETIWPNACPDLYDDNALELKKHVSCVVSQQAEHFPFHRFSNFKRLQRTLAYCLRFAHNSRYPESRKIGSLSATELNDAVTCLVRISPQETFPKDFKNLESQTSVTPKSTLLRLNPFTDNLGILRVGGRLQMSNFGYEKKHPVLLSSKHILTKLLFSHEHIRLLHASPQLLLSSIRESYWPIGGRKLAKQIVHQCVRCFRVKPTQTAPIMGVLPSSRVQQKPAFHTVGVDYAGPIMIKDKKGRGCKPIKSYICLFICFTTRAIHFELVSDLTTESFIGAFRIFVSRRGKPHEVYSDNGTNFVGAAFELAKFLLIQNESLTESFALEGIKWKFIPAHSPHFGGYWEAGVKSTKYHLRRVLSNSLLTFEEMYTTLTQIEAVLNSRPLTPISSDPNDYDVLTPAHFLIGQRITALPDPNLKEIPENRLSKFQRAQQLQQHFWTRWSKEYVSELQQRVKWNQQSTPLRKGAMVVIKEDHLPPLFWRLGRITQLFPGPDNVSRVALIKTKNGEVKRCFSKICVLPVDVSETP